MKALKFLVSLIWVMTGSMWGPDVDLFLQALPKERRDEARIVELEKGLYRVYYRAEPSDMELK